MSLIRFVRLLAAALVAAILVSPLVLSADQGSARPFHVNLTEEFSFFGCPDGVDPNGVDTCGTARAHPFGYALVGTLITGFTPLPSGCFHDLHTTTLDFGAKGQLVIDIDATLCPTGGDNFELLGQYLITGGTNLFSDATGEGLVVASRNEGPIDSELVGLIRLK